MARSQRARKNREGEGEGERRGEVLFRSHSTNIFHRGEMMPCKYYFRKEIFFPFRMSHDLSHAFTVKSPAPIVANSQLTCMT